MTEKKAPWVKELRDRPGKGRLFKTTPDAKTTEINKLKIENARLRAEAKAKGIKL